MYENEREGYIDGLRKLADLLEAKPNCPVPYSGSRGNNMLVFAKTPEQIKAWAKALGNVKKEYGNDDDVYNFSLYGTLGTIPIKVLGEREGVCERVVVGSEEIEITEPDPDFERPEVPMITRKVTKEIVEWNCGSLLEDANDKSA